MDPHSEPRNQGKTRSEVVKQGGDAESVGMVHLATTTLDGYAVELSLEKGRGGRYKDFFTELKEFGETVTYWFLTLKGDPRVLTALYSPIRAKSEELVGLLPIAMPITSVSNLAIFLWPQSVFEKLSETEILSSFTSAIALTKVGKIPSPDKRALREQNPELYVARKMGRRRRHPRLEALGLAMIVAILLYLVYVYYLSSSVM